MNNGPGFLTGTAGTGKSTLVKETLANDPSFGVVTASTGVASVNLGATTIHSLFKFSNEASLERKSATGRLHHTIAELFDDGVLGRNVILDEVSMINARTLDLLHNAIDKATNGDANLILTGDFAQLPPVDGEFAFKANCWPVYDANVMKLTKIWRQTDLLFLDALAQVRRGDKAGARALVTAGVEYSMWLDPHFDGVTLVATNKEADAINAQRWAELPGEPVRFTSHRDGEHDDDWKMIPEFVDVKIGSRVMVTANDSQFDYANGDTGVVTEFCYAPNEVEFAVKVLLDRTKKESMIAFQVRKHLTHHGGTRCVGKIRFMPLKLAYALTTHKAQGLTFDNVQIDPRHWFAGSPGLMYVALSRARTAAGVKIIGPVDLMEKRITAHVEVGHWL